MEDVDKCNNNEMIKGGTRMKLPQIQIKKTDKLGLGQTQEPICKTSK